MPRADGLGRLFDTSLSRCHGSGGTPEGLTDATATEPAKSGSDCPGRRERVAGKTEAVPEGAVTGVSHSDGATGADPGDPAGLKSVAAYRGTDGAAQMRAAFGPVQAGTDRRAPRGRR